MVLGDGIGMVVMGGLGSNGERLNDIWRSDDGKVGAIIRSSDDPSRQTRLIDSQVKRVRPLCRVINRLLCVYRLRH